jgi:hypothetical protein
MILVYLLNISVLYENLKTHPRHIVLRADKKTTHLWKNKKTRCESFDRTVCSPRQPKDHKAYEKTENMPQIIIGTTGGGRGRARRDHLVIIIAYVEIPIQVM